MADILILPHSGCRTLVLDGTKRLPDCQSARSQRILRHTMRASIPKLQRNNVKNANQVELAMVPKYVASCSNGTFKAQWARPQQWDVDTTLG